MRWRVLFVAIVIGFGGLVVSSLNTDNPMGADDIYGGYPIFWLNTSRRLLIPSLLIPVKINVLWAGFIVDMLLYSSCGLVASYLIFTLGENMRLVRFFIKSGAVVFVSTYIIYVFPTSGQATPYGSPPFITGFYAAFFISLPGAAVSTIVYGYYRLFKKNRAQKDSERVTG